MIQNFQASPVVVTGATGRVGRPLVDELSRSGRRVRAVTRDPGSATFAPGIDVASSVLDALRGAGSVFLNSRALGTQLDTVVSRAVEEQVGRLVALSAANIDDDDALQPSRFRGDRNREVDQLAMASGLPAVSLRPSVFASTAADMWAAQIKNGDVVRGPFAGASFAPVVDEDIAAMAAHALTDDTLVGRRVVVTGPEVLTVAEQVAIIGEVIGRPLRFVEVGPDAVRAAMTGAGAKPVFVDAYLALQRAAVDAPVTVTDEIASVTGRPAARFREWVVAHRDAFDG